MPLINISSSFFQLSLLFIPALLIYLYIILPLQRLSFYRKQGVQTSYFPIIGLVKAARRDLKIHGDSFAEVKASSKTSPNQKALAVNLSSKVVLLLRDPQYMKEFLQNPMNYQKGKIFNILKPLLGHGLLFVEGETWKAHRKIISTCFHYEFLKHNTALIQETAREFLDKIPPEDYKNCLVMDRIQEITGEVVGRMFFGRHLNQYNLEGKPLTLALASLMSELGSFIRHPIYILFGTKALSLPLPRLKKLTQRIKDLRAQCSKIVEDRKRRNEKYNDLLDALLAQQKLGDEKTMTDEDIVNEFITFFFAGMDTTGHLITMALYNLTQYPQYIEKLKEERDETYNKSSEITAEIVQSMNVMTCFLKETLRHYTPAPIIFVRESEKDQKLLDLTIKKGTMVRIDPFATYFNSKYYEEPEKFLPERWENSSQKLDPYAFIPFSAGARNCIGQHLAMLEARIILSEFLERFGFTLGEGYKLKMNLRLLYEPVEDMRMDLVRKNGGKCSEVSG